MWRIWVSLIFLIITFLIPQYYAWICIRTCGLRMRVYGCILNLLLNEYIRAWGAPRFIVFIDLLLSYFEFIGHAMRRAHRLPTFGFLAEFYKISVILAGLLQNVGILAIGLCD